MKELIDLLRSKIMIMKNQLNDKIDKIVPVGSGSRLTVLHQLYSDVDITPSFVLNIDISCVNGGGRLVELIKHQRVVL